MTAGADVESYPPCRLDSLAYKRAALIPSHSSHCAGCATALGRSLAGVLDLGQFDYLKPPIEVVEAGKMAPVREIVSWSWLETKDSRQNLETNAGVAKVRKGERANKRKKNKQRIRKPRGFVHAALLLLLQVSFFFFLYAACVFLMRQEQSKQMSRDKTLLPPTTFAQYRIPFFNIVFRCNINHEKSSQRFLQHMQGLAAVQATVQPASAFTHLVHRT